MAFGRRSYHRISAIFNREERGKEIKKRKGP
jgi:hypothetical protein